MEVEMKKLAILIGILAVVGLGTGARATEVNINFNELASSGVTVPAGVAPRYDGVQIGGATPTDLTAGNQPYLSQGITWGIDPTAPYQYDPYNWAGQVVVGSGDWTSLTNSALYYYGTSGAGTTPVTSWIYSPTSDYFSFQATRPNVVGNFDVTLFMDNTQIYNQNFDTGTFGTGWVTFTYDAEDNGDLAFNKIRIGGDGYTDKTITDNYVWHTVDAAPVPDPGVLVLLAPGLAALVAIRKRKTEE
jgi:hypothetical protein